ncbi:hypothetical protein AHAS_Ahas05G0092400 [Arachis hypogaea]
MPAYDLPTWVLKSNFHQAEARQTILREEGCIPDGYEWREVLLCTADSDPNALGSRATPPRQSLISGETPGVKIWHVSPMLFFVGRSAPAASWQSRLMGKPPPTAMPNENLLPRKLDQSKTWHPTVDQALQIAGFYQLS